MKRTLIIAFIFFTQRITAQYLRIHETTNLSGINSVAFNPSLMAGSKYNWQFNLGTINTQFGANTLNNSYVPFSKIELKADKIAMSPSATDIIGPSFMLQTAKYGTLGLSTRYQSAQTNNSIVTDFFQESEITGTDNYIANGVKTLTLSYAYPISYKKHAMNLGLSILRNAGYYSSTFSSIILSRPLFNSNVAYSSNQIDEKFSINKVFASKVGATGFDFGFIYEYRPKADDYSYIMDGKSYADNSANKYAVRFGLAIVNGGINKAFGKSNTKVFSKTIVPSDIKALDLSGDYNKALSTLDFPQNENPFTSPSIFSPRLNLILEGALGKSGWFLGAVSKSSTQKNSYQPNILAFYPKYEKEGLEFAIPVTHNSMVKQTGVGMHLRLGSLFFGGEALNAFFTKNAIKPSFYVGFSISKKATKIKDKDGDSVSDKLDKCIDLAGLWAFMGCPDIDNDGIEDKLDKCPEHAGPKETNGCPDADGDGIFDNVDACPKVAGLPKFNGCPDTDGDGIMDSEDDCPTQAGKLEDGGCPDTDGDGIIDSKDNCPTVKGTKENKGCPKAP